MPTFSRCFRCSLDKINEGCNPSLAAPTPFPSGLVYRSQCGQPLVSHDHSLHVCLAGETRKRHPVYLQGIGSANERLFPTPRLATPLLRMCAAACEGGLLL